MLGKLLLVLSILLLAVVATGQASDPLHDQGSIRAPGMLPLPQECKYTPPSNNTTIPQVHTPIVIGDVP